MCDMGVVEIITLIESILIMLVCAVIFAEAEKDLKIKGRVDVVPISEWATIVFTILWLLWQLYKIMEIVF